MTAPDADAGALREHYRDLIEINRRAEGVRYSGALPNAAPVEVLALGSDLTQRLRTPDQFLAALERASRVRDELLGAPVAFGRLGDVLHCAFPRDEPIELLPGMMGPREVAEIGIQLSRALANAHASGLVHGSITTERITKTARGAVLRDFGLFSALTCGGLECGDVAILLSDPAFVSPEVRMGASPDERSDVFSLGAALYELLTGKPPYGGRTTSFVMASLLSDSAEYHEPHGSVATDPASAKRTEPVVEALVRAIEQAPEDRWPSAGAFAAALAVGVADASTTAEREADARGWLARLKRFFS